MNLSSLFHFSLPFIIGTICLFSLFYWLIIIAYRLYLIRNKHKRYFNTPDLDPRIHSQILYSFQTVRNRDICLVILILLEILILALLSFVMPPYIVNDLKSDNKIKEIFPNCSIEYPITLDFYVHPVLALPFVIPSILTLTQLMLLSLLNSYLSGRYFGHRFPKRVVYKYIFIWTFQSFLLGVFIIPKLQILHIPTITLLVFLNWLNLVISSRKMCRAIQSKMKEIRLFEWDANMFRNYSRNLKQYRIAMGFLIIAFFFLILALGSLAISYFIFVESCFIYKAYGINLNFNMSYFHTIRKYIYNFDAWIVFLCLLLYAILLFLPSLGVILYHVANLLYDKCTGKGNMRKINNALFQPLMN